MKSFLLWTALAVCIGLIYYGQMCFHVQDIPCFRKMALPFAVCFGLLVLCATFAYEEKWLGVSDASFWKRVKTHAALFFVGFMGSLFALGLLNGCAKVINFTHTFSVHRKLGVFEGGRMGFAGGRPTVSIRKIVIRLDSMDHDIQFPVRNGVYEDFKAGERIVAEYEIGLFGLMKGIEIRHVNSMDLNKN